MVWSGWGQSVSGGIKIISVLFSMGLTELGKIYYLIQDFTYEEDYFKKWVEGDAGGPGLEFHSFHHIDMPLQQVNT